jgi:hypothetical protein
VPQPAFRCRRHCENQCVVGLDGQHAHTLRPGGIRGDTYETPNSRPLNPPLPEIS